MKHALFFLMITALMASMGHAQNVGIGTTSPTLGKLVVRGTVGAVSAIFGDNTAGVSLMNSAPSIGFNYYYGGGAKSINTGFGASVGIYDNTGQFFIATSATSVTGQGTAMPLQNRILIQPNGNVGIGGITPTNILDVNGRIRVRQTGLTAGIGFDGKDAGNNPQIDRGFIGMVNNDYIGFYGSGGAGWGMAMNVNTGNVGIGIATPSAKLDIRSTGSETGLYVGKSGTGVGMQVNSTTTSPALYATGTNGPAFSTEGKVGVNVAYPNSTLQVAGGISLPYKRITDADYSVTDNDYSIHAVLTAATGINKTITLPSAVGRTGRIYNISSDLPHFNNSAGNLPDNVYSRIYILDALGADVIANSRVPFSASYNSLCNNSQAYNVTSDSYFINYKFKQTSITVQSDGTNWKIIMNDFSSYNLRDHY